jgi:hypothetical protein
LLVGYKTFLDPIDTYRLIGYDCERDFADGKVWYAILMGLKKSTLFASWAGTNTGFLW